MDEEEPMNTNTRVLLVDDEVAIRRQLRVAMARSGYDAAESGDALEALKSIEHNAREGRPFDVVVTDMVLPDIDGIKLLSIIKSRYPDLKVVVISGYGNEETPHEVEQSRGDGFMAKPFETEELTSMLNDLHVGSVPAEAVEASTSVSSYLFVSVAEGEDPMAVYEALAYESGVVYCDAIRDAEHQILLLLHGATHQETEARVADLVRRVPGIERSECVHVRPPYIPDEIRSYINDYDRENEDSVTFHRSANRATAYLRLDVSAGELSGLYTRLYFIDEVVEIDASVAGDQLILLLQGSDFQRIRRVVSDRIRHMEGILRIRDLKVISFDKV
jgi:CheY-like chemotaxis protein